jgi:hypothetical protein
MGFKNVPGTVVHSHRAVYLLVVSIPTELPFTDGNFIRRAKFDRGDKDCPRLSRTSRTTWCTVSTSVIYEATADEVGPLMGDVLFTWSCQELSLTAHMVCLLVLR